MPRSRWAPLGAALLLTGCGGGDGGGAAQPPDVEESYAQYHSAPAIMADGFEAMLDLRSVHLRAEVRDGDATTVMDLGLRRDGDCAGRLQIPGWSGPADFTVVDGRDYLRGTASFWSLSADPRAAERYADRWVSTGELASYCDFERRMSPFTRAIDEQLASKDGVAEIGGAEAVKVSTPTSGGRLRLWVQVAEPHHVPRVELTGGRATGELELSAFDEPVEVEAPPTGEVVEFTP